MDKPFYYNVVIEEATIPENYQNIYVEYAVKSDDKNSATFKTQIVLLVRLRFLSGRGTPFSVTNSCTSSTKSTTFC